MSTFFNFITLCLNHHEKLHSNKCRHAWYLLINSRNAHYNLRNRAYERAKLLLLSIPLHAFISIMTFTYTVWRDGSSHHGTDGRIPDSVQETSRAARGRCLLLGVSICFIQCHLWRSLCVHVTR